MGRSPYLVCTAEEADERLLAKVFEADQRTSSNKLNFIENYNAALELVKAKEAEDRRQEDHEIAAAVIRNPKSSYKVRNRQGELIDLERSRRSDPRKAYIW